MRFAKGRQKMAFNGVSIRDIIITDAWFGGIKNIKHVKQLGDQGDEVSV